MAKKGVKQTKEHRMKISIALKGKHNSPKTEFKKGHPCLLTKEAREKAKITNKGNTYSKGIVRSDEFKKNLSRKMKGKNNPAWKGGIAPKRALIMRGLKYKQWREKVFKKDNYTCQNCGKKNCYIVAHHIKSFSKHPKLMFDIENGQSLCVGCHKLTSNFIIG